MLKKIPSFLLVVLIASAAALLPLWVKGLTFEEIKHAQTGKILGESTYSPTTLVKNRSLEVVVTPTSFEQDKWQYKIEWKRTLNKKLSIYLNNQPLMEEGESAGSTLTGFILPESSKNKVEVYSLPFRQGVLLSRKYFTTLTKPETTLVACPADAKLCEDGKTYVSRQGPSCEFTACPTLNTPPPKEEKTQEKSNKQEPYIWIDGLDPDKEQSGGVPIVGWAVDGKDGWEDQLGKIEILIDNKVVSSWKKGDPLWEYGNSQLYGVYRPDVCTHLKLVPNCLPEAENLYNRTGFFYNWDTTQASNGTHTITVRATDSGSLAKTQEYRWQLKINNRVSTIYAANYFIHATDGGKVEGQPVEFLPDTQGIYNETGTWNNASQKDYWKSTSGQKGFLSYGPYIKEQDLEAAFVQKNPGLSQRDNDWYIYRVGWELKVENNAFSDKPVGTVDILASSEAKEFYLVRSIDIYPQDFKQNDTFQEITMLLADFHAAFKPNPRLEFRVNTYGATGMAIRSIKIYPMAFLPFWSTWSNMTWSREKGFEPTGFINSRICDPERIRTSLWTGNKPSLLSNIEWWQRDVCFTSGAYPYIGPYNQINDSSLIRYQIRLAQAASIEAFRLYTYPPDTYSGGQCQISGLSLDDGAFSHIKLLFELAEQEDFKVFLDDSVLAEVTPNNPKGQGYSYEDAACAVEFYARAGLFTRPGYLTINGQPVFGVPVIHETNPANIESLMSKLNEAYRRGSGKSGNLFTMVTAMTAYSADDTDTNIFGPYNGQIHSLFTWNMDDLSKTPPGRTPNNFNKQTLQWQKYAVCKRAPKTYWDILNPSVCSCKYEPSRPVDPICFHKTTLLERPELASFRNLKGVSVLYDWTNTLAVHGAQYSYPANGRWDNVRGQVNINEIKESFSDYVNDARKYGYQTAITLSPATHARPRVIDWQGKKVVQFRETLAGAMAAQPDIIMLEAFNNWGEGVQLEPAVNYTNEYGQNDPYLFLRIVAQSRGRNFIPPCIPRSIVDPLRLPYLPAQELCDN